MTDDSNVELGAHNGRGTWLAARARVVRIRIGVERAAGAEDPLGRRLIGYADGLGAAELWARARGIWKAKLATLADTELAVIVHGGRVVLVATVEGVRFVDGRVAIQGRPMPEHPLVGLPDPIPNASPQPLAYGEIATVVPRSTPTRPYDTLLGDAVAVLSEATRLRRRTLRPVDGTPGRWETDPDRTEPVDWAEFVCLALASAAANAGGIEAALAGRPGSWEASRVRDLLESQIGDEERNLMEYRTEPLRIAVDAPELLSFFGYDYLYDAAGDAIATDADQARQQYDTGPLHWRYTHDGAGNFVPVDPEGAEAGAPEFSYDAFRDSLITLGHQTQAEADRWIEGMKEGIALEAERGYSMTGARIVKAGADVEEIRRLDAAADAAEAPYDELATRLGQLRARDVDEYRRTLTAAVQAEAERRYPGVDVVIVDQSPPAAEIGDSYGWRVLDDLTYNDRPEDLVLRQAVLTTPLPGIGIAPADYPGGLDAAARIGDTEAAAGRFPHLRNAHANAEEDR